MVRKFALLLENYPYGQVFKYADELRTKNIEQYQAINESVATGALFAIISDHKIALAKILISKSKVNALQEDRTRVVWLLSKYVNSNLKAVNHAFESEFGPDFKIFEQYQIGDKTKTWKELALKAKQIKNGYRNYDFLNVRGTANFILTFYRNFNINDEKKLEYLSDLGYKILTKSKENPLETINSPGMEEVKKQVIDFYKNAQRLPLDIEALNNEPQMDDINEFVFLVKTASDLRLEQIKIKADLKDTTEVEKYLFEVLGTSFSDSYMGDELSRIHVKLQPIK